MPDQTGTCAEANDPSLTSGATAALSVVEQAATQGIRTLIRDEDRRLACGVPVNLHSRPDSAVVARVGGNRAASGPPFFYLCSCSGQDFSVCDTEMFQNLFERNAALALTRQ